MSDAVSIKLTGAENVTWDLTDLYKNVDDPAIDSDLDRAESLASELGKKYHGRIATLKPVEMAEFIKSYEEVTDILYRTASYAYLYWSTRTEDSAAGALLGKATERTSRIGQKMIFFDLEWANAADDHAKTLIDNKDLTKWRHWLELSRRYKPYLLSEPEEKLLSEKAITGREAWSRFIDEVLGAARFEFNGEQVPEQVVLSKLYDAERSVREKAAESMTAGLKQISRSTTYIFNTLLADKASDDQLRKYPSWISSRNLANEVEDVMVDALVNAVTSRYDIVARYYKLKRKLLGLDELYDYDRYAPLPAADRQYSWDSAKEIILSAYSAFHPEMAKIAHDFFDKRWIDAAVIPGKRSGAYSHPVSPTVHPYVFMNYEGTPREVMTLAHELGHGVHQWLSREQGVLQCGTPLTTAETASVFGEMLVFHDLMRNESEPRLKLAMLTSKIEDNFATVFRQVTMNRFEDAIHNARRADGELPTEKFNELWLKTQRAMFGDSVTMTENYGIWWSYVTHFTAVPGYVYAYAFGNLLVLALYARYQEVGPEFAENYLAMLESGGADWPHEIMKPLGVDLGDPEFWNHGIKILEDMVKEAEDMAQAT